MTAGSLTTVQHFDIDQTPPIDNAASAICWYKYVIRSAIAAILLERLHQRGTGIAVVMLGPKDQAIKSTIGLVARALTGELGDAKLMAGAQNSMQTSQGSVACMPINSKSALQGTAPLRNRARKQDCARARPRRRHGQRRG
jgi:hypothetical protein